MTEENLDKLYKCSCGAEYVANQEFEECPHLKEEDND